LDPKIIDYNLNSLAYLQIDVSQKDKFKKFTKLIEKDTNVYNCSEVISNGEHNLAINFISKNIESQHNNIRRNYLLVIPNYFDFVKKTTTFYLSAPFYKQKNIVDSVIDLLKEKHGFD
jgi:DNA-binding Lrp family transcriptional regulator